MKKLLLITSVVAFSLLITQVAASTDKTDYQQSGYNTDELPSEH